ESGAGEAEHPVLGVSGSTDCIKQVLVGVLPDQFAGVRLDASQEVAIAVEVDPAVPHAGRPTVDLLLLPVIPEHLLRPVVDGQDRPAEAEVVVLDAPPRPARAADAVTLEWLVAALLLANQCVQDVAVEGHPLPDRSVG